jgi:hypothetical protein
MTVGVTRQSDVIRSLKSSFPIPKSFPKVSAIQLIGSTPWGLNLGYTVTPACMKQQFLKGNGTESTQALRLVEDMPAHLATRISMLQPLANGVSTVSFLCTYLTFSTL